MQDFFRARTSRLMASMNCTIKTRKTLSYDSASGAEICGRQHISSDRQLACDSGEWLVENNFNTLSLADSSCSKTMVFFEASTKVLGSKWRVSGTAAPPSLSAYPIAS